MFCTNCGNRTKEGEVFCTGCGNPNSSKLMGSNNSQVKIVKDEKWWHRLMRVLYLVSYLPLLGIIPLVWSENNSSYKCSDLSYQSYLNNSCHYVDTYGKAFLWSLITLAIYLIIIRLIKLSIIYITFGEKPKWKKEFKKFY